MGPSFPSSPAVSESKNEWELNSSCSYSTFNFGTHRCGYSNQVLEFVISESRKQGVRLILRLGNNIYEDFGGRRWGRLSSDDLSYTDEIDKGYFKQHVEVFKYNINTSLRLSFLIHLILAEFLAEAAYQSCLHRWPRNHGLGTDQRATPPSWSPLWRNPKRKFSRSPTRCW